MSRNRTGSGRNRQRGATGTRNGASRCNSIAFGIFTARKGRGEKWRYYNELEKFHIFVSTINYILCGPIASPATRGSEPGTECGTRGTGQSPADGVSGIATLYFGTR